MALLTTQKKIVGPAQFELDLEVRIKRAGRPPWFSIFSISYDVYIMYSISYTVYDIVYAAYHMQHMIC